MTDEAPILVVAGLGNPGRRYSGTWHNLGFMALDFWADGKGLAFRPGRGDYTYLEYRTARGVITFLKPTSYMNLSGGPIGQILRYRKLTPENLLVVCDDVALPVGTIRIRRRGSSGGHKGLDSIIAGLGSEDFVRLRLGIFTEGWLGTLEKYVLAGIPTELHDSVSRVLRTGAEAIDYIIRRGSTPAMNQFNRNILDNPEDQDNQS